MTSKVTFPRSAASLLALTLLLSPLTFLRATLVDFVNSGNITGTVSGNTITWDISSITTGAELIITAGSTTFGSWEAQSSNDRFGYADTNGSADETTFTNQIDNLAYNQENNGTPGDPEYVTISFTLDGDAAKANFDTNGLSIRWITGGMDYSLNGGPTANVAGGTANVLANQTDVTTLLISAEAASAGQSNFGLQSLGIDSVVAIPEPSTFALVGLALATLLCFRRKG